MTDKQKQTIEQKIDHEHSLSPKKTGTLMTHYPSTINNFLPMPKFITTYNQMIKQHKAEFEEFKKVHDQFKTDRQTYQKEFNEKGKPIVDIIREYEQQLCGGMERGQFGKYSDQVAEKFWGRVKKDFSHIELVGVEIVNG